MNNASIPALQYHSSLVHSAWLNTNPVNLEVSALPGEIIHSEAPFQTQSHFLTVEDHWNSQTLDWRAWWQARPCGSLQHLTGFNVDHVLSAGPGLYEQLLTISSSMREMHTKRGTPWHTRTMFSISVMMLHAARIKAQPAWKWMLHLASWLASFTSSWLLNLLTSNT